MSYESNLVTQIILLFWISLSNVFGIFQTHGREIFGHLAEYEIHRVVMQKLEREREITEYEIGNCMPAQPSLVFIKFTDGRPRSINYFTVGGHLIHTWPHLLFWHSNNNTIITALLFG